MIQFLKILPVTYVFMLKIAVEKVKSFGIMIITQPLKIPQVVNYIPGELE